MRIARVACLLALAFLPATASAAVVVHVDLRFPWEFPVDGIYLFDVWLETDDQVNERLDAFTIAIDGPRNQPNGVRFLQPIQLPTARHPYVFAGVPGSEPEDFGSTYNRVQVGAAITGAGVDVTDGMGLFAIPVYVPAFSGGYPFVIDPQAFSLGGSGPLVAVPSPLPGGIGFPAEPATLTLLFPALLMLARTRRPARPAFPSQGA